MAVVVGPSPLHASREKRLTSSLGRFAARHWLFGLFLLAGTALRILVTIAYWPALEFFGDSYIYLARAQDLHPNSAYPLAYPALLRLLSMASGSLGVVSIVQHALGLGLAVLIYALLLRHGVRSWLAALAAAPVLLGGYQLDIEQLVLAEVLTDVLLLAGMAVLLWPGRPRAVRGGVAGVLLGLATISRTAALPVLVVPALYLLLRGRWRSLGSYCAAAIVVAGGYVGWTAVANQNVTTAGMTGYYLYGRVAPFATCDYPMPSQERRLCPALPVATRSHNLEFYVWEGSPLNGPGLGTHVQRNKLALKFSEDVIRHQPFTYLRAVAADTWHYFTPGHWMTPGSDTIDMSRWRLPSPALNGNAKALHIFFADAGYDNKPLKPTLDFALMDPLRRYQSIVDVGDGTIYLVSLLGAIWAAVGLGRRRTRRRQVRWAALVLAVSGLVLAITPSVITGFSYRYGLPLVVLLPPAGILAADVGLDALARRTRRRRARAASAEPPPGREAVVRVQEPQPG